MRAGSAAALVLAAALALGGCGDRANGTPAKGATPPAVPVTAADATERPVPLDIRAIGSVQAFTTVGVKSQVAGQIMQVHFTEGRDVRQGDLLFTIDPRPFEAALRQAEATVGRDMAALRQAEAAQAQRQAEVQQAQANLERDIAQLENARTQERRYRELVDKELIAREQYDQLRTNLAAMEATVNADRAAVENARASALAAQAGVENVRAVIRADQALVDSARLQLNYTTIRSPMSGRTGNLLVQAGNVVKSNEDNPLVVIAEVHPIYVSFSVPEQHLDGIKRYQTKDGLLVRATPPGAARSTTGRLTFVNNLVDSTTGTIQLKGTFANEDNTLWPGQYVDVVLTLTTEQAVTVPAEAVQAGQEGPFVFVVKADSKVEPRPVQIGRRVDKDIIVTRGLAAGERVVTDGQLRLVPGSKVDIRPKRT
ncbi:MAG TPA: efflux RND transporter periplasmic adaptor subunit [Methylomirabilota bacterium]|jgi:multidrug efflux system membrane fusion protein|nr:efflux RND transporter periplasmic adaptor subunit [Methylomirabilota bacterium]